MEPKPIKAVLTVELTLPAGVTIRDLKGSYAKGETVRVYSNGSQVEAQIDQLIGAGKIQPIPKEPKP